MPSKIKITSVAYYRGNVVNWLYTAECTCGWALADLADWTHVAYRARIHHKYGHIVLVPAGSRGNFA